jgi:pimeloyl-ACP methyl ester carboxylesterase
MEPLATENVLIKGLRIAYGVYGAADAQHPVVLVHGTPSSSLIWRNIIPGLLSSGIKIYVFDLLGYGLSERPIDPSVDTSITGQVPILEGLLAHWGLDTFHLVAHDIGGGIAQRFAIFSPERVRSLTLIDVVSFDSYPSKRTKEQMKNGLDVLIKAKDEDHRAHFRAWLLSAVQNQQKLSDDILNVYLDYISGPVGQASLFQHQVRHYDPKHTMEIASRYHELGKLPVKLVWGANDSWQVVDWARKLNAAIPGSSLDVIDNCGHFSPEDQPEQISAILATFLKDNL